ncbi:MAG TPA: Rrf2 family transcriptional regulator [Flavobacteriales bacterium]|nr:Rrf2 family transcriptional regulator [Flavobacteriales bacterium]
MIIHLKSGHLLQNHLPLSHRTGLARIGLVVSPLFEQGGLPSVIGIAGNAIFARSTSRPHQSEVAMFSKACEYAIRACVQVARVTDAGHHATVKGIAEATGAPEAFTAKVLQQLVRAGLVDSIRGRGGGFSLSPARARELTLLDIVNCIDGDGVFTRCGLGLPHCNASRPCPLHEKFAEVRGRLRMMLETTSVRNMVDQLGEANAGFTGLR